MSDRPNATERRTNDDPTTDLTGLVGVSVTEAAERLGISTEAVRMRLKRRTLPGDRDQAGHWRVWLPIDEQPANTDPTPSQQPTEQATQRDRTPDLTVANALVDHLRDEVNFLRGQLADAQAALDQRSRELAAERERFDVLHREALTRIPALGAGQDAPSAAPAVHHATEPTNATAEALPWWTSWWRRLVGGSG